jgi:hypothetical protein
MLNNSDLLSLLAKKEKLLKVLEDQNMTLTFDLVRERLKAKTLEKDQSNFRTACKTTANQAVTLRKIELARLKDCMKSQAKSKQYLLKAKDVRFKETVALHRNTLTNCTKQAGIIAALQKTHSAQVITISTLNGGIMAKIRECDIFKKENKSLTSQVMALERKSLVIDERKMEHVLQLNRMVLETDSLKVKKLEQTKVLKVQTNHQEHKRKLEAV